MERKSGSAGRTGLSMHLCWKPSLLLFYCAWKCKQTKEEGSEDCL